MFLKYIFPILFCFSSSISRYLYADPLHCNMTYLLLRLLKDDLKEYTYAARLAGLVYGVASGMNAILVSNVVSLPWPARLLVDPGRGTLFEALRVCRTSLGFASFYCYALPLGYLLTCFCMRFV